MRLLGFVLLLTILSGCGSDYPETAIVTGKVTYRGQPLAFGHVCFWPEEGRPARGEIRPDGTYRLTSFREGDGAIPGKHRVSIASKREVFPNAPKSSSAVAYKAGWGDNPGVEWFLPKEFERPETSGLTAEVHSGTNTIDFDLPVKNEKP